jgi:hypothetical protein
MISDTTLTNLSNGLGVSAMLLIVVYHFIAVNGKRMEAQGGKTVADLVSSIVEQRIVLILIDRTEIIAGSLLSSWGTTTRVEGLVVSRDQDVAGGYENPMGGY